MQAQSVSEEQMDERFNDGTELPYGWFTEGWTVKDGVILTEASSGAALSVGAVRAWVRRARGISDGSENRPLIRFFNNPRILDVQAVISIQHTLQRQELT